jgi:RHS repeat-associated protein
VTDRLGSVRANSNGERMNYFPYGEERTATLDGREKFGEFFRDPGGIDYAEKRYYASVSGRFLTPEAYLGHPESPGKWNQYAYVQGDPVNFSNPHGGEEEEDPFPPSEPIVPIVPSGPGGGDEQSSGGGPPQPFPACNPKGIASENTDLAFITNNYSGAMTAANTIQADLHAINADLNIDVGALAVTFLQWSASETGTDAGWGTGYLLKTQHNYFGAQVNTTGSIPCVGAQYVAGSTNACFSPSTSFSDELAAVLSSVPHTLTNSNPNNGSYLGYILGDLVSHGFPGTAAFMQVIADAGWNPSPTYGSKVAGANVQGRLDCLKQNGYIK